MKSTRNINDKFIPEVPADFVPRHREREYAIYGVLVTGFFALLAVLFIIIVFVDLYIVGLLAGAVQ